MSHHMSPGTFIDRGGGQGPAGHRLPRSQSSLPFRRRISWMRAGLTAWLRWTRRAQIP
jgi:hypothetical protein